MLPYSLPTVTVLRRGEWLDMTIYTVVGVGVEKSVFMGCFTVPRIECHFCNTCYVENVCPDVV